MTDKTPFVDGLRVYAPHERAPDFVKGAIVIEREKLAAWLATQTEDKIRIDIKESRGGNWYAAVSTYKPGAKKEPPKDKPKSDEFVDDEIPF